MISVVWLVLLQPLGCVSVELVQVLRSGRENRGVHLHMLFATFPGRCYEATQTSRFGWLQSCGGAVPFVLMLVLLSMLGALMPVLLSKLGALVLLVLVVVLVLRESMHTIFFVSLVLVVNHDHVRLVMPVPVLLAKLGLLLHVLMEGSAVLVDFVLMVLLVPLLPVLLVFLCSVCG